MEIIMPKTMQCFLGFSTSYTNPFSEHLERRGTALERHYREANGDLLLGLKRLHDAVDAALARNVDDASSGVRNGLGLLDSCNDHLTAIGEELVRARSELFEQEGVDSDDPLIAREPFFATIDIDAMYRELAAYGAALPQRAFWDDLASRVRDGGARAGLRLLDRHLRELQSDLRTFVGEVESMRRLPLAELGPTLHGTSRAVGTIMMSFMRLLTSFLYFGMLCERASQLYEASTGEGAAAVAVAS
jgi:hypothetical protein